MSIELKRCAIYTRKSSDEGLEQEFNSLHAQREAAEAYIKSQAHEGWRLIETEFDDGGFSGSSMERPGLKKLLAAIELDQVDVIVVYKIDRLTRSLADFARMVELFDKHDVSFVSVTQAFNTTTSMGRLTLNVLLSFAQFEREVTGERIRDKIAASKAKGMWMGGMLPIGYDKPIDNSRILQVNDSEAETVRLIYEKYLELGSVHALERWLDDQKIRSKKWTSSSGRQMGDQPFSRGALFHLLKNQTYLGKIQHKGTLHEGGHGAIIDQQLFDAVQSHLAARAKTTKERNNPVRRAPLTGIIFDAVGEPMSPTFSHGARGQVYRYYVSSSLQKGGESNPNILQRVPATDLENHLTQILVRLVPGHQNELLKLPTRIEVHEQSVQFLLPHNVTVGIRARLRSGESAESELGQPDLIRVSVPLHLRKGAGRTLVRTSEAIKTRKDQTLISALRKAHRIVDLDTKRRPVLNASPGSPYLRNLVRLAFLAPDLQLAILDGNQPAGLNLERLKKIEMPLSWSEQRVLFQSLSGH